MDFHQDLEIKIMEIPEATSTGVIFKEPKIKIYKNPFQNISEFLEYYKHLGTNAPIDELRAFADDAYHKSKYPLIMDRLTLYNFQLRWVKIDYDNMGDIEIYIVNDPFYKDIIENGEIAINWITTYAIAKVELKAFKELPDSDTQILKYYWLYCDCFPESSGDRHPILSINCQIY